MTRRLATLALLAAALAVSASLGTTVGGAAEPGSPGPTAGASDPSERAASKRRGRPVCRVVRRGQRIMLRPDGCVRPTCRVVRHPRTGRRVLRPRGCVRRCRVVRTVRGTRRVVVTRCQRPGRPSQVRPHGVGLVGVTGSGLTANVTAREASIVPPTTHGAAAPGGGDGRTLVLYDTTGPYGWLGELYAMSVANLSSRFGAWTAMPVGSYTAGTLDAYTATIYIGSTYDEPIPDAFLDDAYATTKPVLWIYDNIWRLAARHPGFVDKYGWSWWQFDTSDVPSVTYKGRTLDRSLLNRGGIMQYAPFDASRVEVLATANRADGTTLPWAIRSGNLTYVGENPLTYTGETDRDLVFVDLLYEVLAPDTPERHRALVRLEDLGPNSDPAKLRKIADELHERRIPFGFGVSAEFRDPLRIESNTTRKLLRSEKDVVAALKYLQSRGGVIVNHGLTHQYSNVRNPYDGISGNDFEFYRVTENADFTLNFAGPVPENSYAWARNRINAATTGIRRAGLGTPRIFEFPHYSSSVEGYRAAHDLYGARWERALYFSGQLSGGPVDYSRPIGQRFPYVVRDVYGSTVLPENIGSYEPEAFHQFPAHGIDDIVAGADANMVVRDGFASFYYHHFWGSEPLEQTLDALTARGWTFVSPDALL